MYSWVYTFQGGRYDAVTGKINFRNRDLDTVTGTWMEKDPARYVDGGDQYQMEGSNPVAASDPAGLWEINRQSTKKRATATSANGDTIEDLAKMLKLNSHEWKRWLVDLLPEYHPGLTATTKLGAGCKFSVPNFIIQDYGNSANWNSSVFELPIMRQFQDVGDANKKNWEASGFDVEPHYGASDGLIRTDLRAWSLSRELYGYEFFGHGNGGWINAQKEGGVSPGRYTAYGLAFMHLYACESLTATVPQLKFMGKDRKIQTSNFGDSFNTLWRYNVSPLGELLGYLISPDSFSSDHTASGPGLEPTPDRSIQGLPIRVPPGE